MFGRKPFENAASLQTNDLANLILKKVLSQSSPNGIVRKARGSASKTACMCHVMCMHAGPCIHRVGPQYIAWVCSPFQLQGQMSQPVLEAGS